MLAGKNIFLSSDRYFDNFYEWMDGSMDVRLGLLIDRLMDQCMNGWSCKVVTHVWNWSLCNILLYLEWNSCLEMFKDTKNIACTLIIYKPASHQAKKKSNRNPHAAIILQFILGDSYGIISKDHCLKLWFRKQKLFVSLFFASLFNLPSPFIV
jgi:hypothetical protein